MLQLNHVSKSIKNIPIVRNISFNLREGHILGLFGPNGAGKTTTIRLITNILQADDGKIYVFDQEMNPQTRPALLKKIGVQNDGNLYENLSVRDNLRIWGRLYQLDYKEIDKRIAELLAFFDIQGKLHDPVRTLSKGQKQKILLSRSILHQPKLLILDEPTVGLDPKSQEEFMGYLESMVESYGVSVLMCTHQLDGLDSIVDDMVVINNGVIIAQGEPGKLKKFYWPDSEFTIELDNANEAASLLKGVDDVDKLYSSERMVGFSLTQKDLMPSVVALLSNQGISIYRIEEKKRGIKDLYLKILEEHHDK